MVRQVLSIHPERRETRETVRYEFDLCYSNRARCKVLFYEFERDFAPPPIDNFDGILCAVVLHAMAQGRDIRLHGPATNTILLNLDEFQLAWSRWLPDLYHPVAIEADSVIDTPSPKKPRSIAAFSGGVDSSFTLLRNSAQSSEPRYAVDSVLLVHGFDISLSNLSALRELIDRTRAIREVAGAHLRVIRTNSKELRLQNWYHSSATELAACMHLLSAEFSNALIGSSTLYDAFVPRCGSNPITDHLLSGGTLKIVHDGAAFSRTEKVAFLSGCPAAVQSLKVCWQGEHQGRNCGTCEKCVRTLLNLLAAGISNPPCFDAPLDLRRIPHIPARSDRQLAELRSILDYAERRNIDAEWLCMLRNRVGRGKKSGRTLKQLVKASFARVGLLNTIKSLREELPGGGRRAHSIERS
jgi:hypothetical protein